MSRTRTDRELRMEIHELARAQFGDGFVDKGLCQLRQHDAGEWGEGYFAALRDVWENLALQLSATE